MLKIERSPNGLIKTNNNTPDNVKMDTIVFCNQVLANLLDLSLNTKQAHWNMRGDDFLSIHKELDEFYNSLLVFIDTVAEHIVQLGGTAFGTISAVSTKSMLTPYPTQIDVYEHVSELTSGYSTVSNHIRDNLSTMKNLICQNIMIDIVQTLDKYLWFLEASSACKDC